MAGKDPASKINIDDDLAIQIVARMSFVLVLFHCLIFVITLARNEMAANFHDGCWGTKFFLVGAGFISSWWIDSWFFNSFYLVVGKYLSALFLLYQVLRILAACYLITENLVNNARRDKEGCS